MRTSLRPLRNVGQASRLFLNQSKQAGSLSYLMVITLLGLGLFGCAPQPQKITAPQDQPLAAFQTNLLQIAFDVATAMPVNPHIKDRSKAQAAVVDICFQLDQPQRALGVVEQIGNWRRGSGYADYAFYSVQHGFTNEVETHLNLADEISSLADQDWRRGRIQTKISRTYTLLGQNDQVEHFSKGVEDSEVGKVAQVEAALCEEDAFDSQVADLEKLIASGNFDRVKNSLYVATELFSRFYDNPERRGQMEETIKTSWGAVPLFVRVDVMMALIEGALQHNDQMTALRLVEDARAILNGAVWPAQYHIPLAARLAALRFRAGDAETAQVELQAERDRFSEKQAEIVNIYKAETLTPVAEALYTMDDVSAARTVYMQALNAAVENPNSRPRAEDLSSICLSMAVNGIEPDEVLWHRIKEIQNSLGAPW